MESLKIALVSDWYFPKIGGVAIHVHNLAIHLRKMGHEVSIVTNALTNGKEGELQKYGIDLIKVPGLIKDGINLSMIAKSSNSLVEYLKGFDVVHAQHAFTPLSLKSIPAGNKVGALTLVTNHSVEFENFSILNGFSKMSYSYFKMYLGQVKVGIGVSKASVSFLRKFTNAPIVEIPNGVNIERFNGRGREWGTRNILYVGRLEPRKGVNYLISAMKFVEGKLTIVGDGSMRKVLKMQAKKLGVEDKVEFLGFISQEELILLYKKSEVFVLPSLSEAFGIVLLEAMASEVPVIGTSVGGIPEIIGDAGIIVPPRDSKALANAINAILSNQKTAKRLGKLGRKRVERLYSWDVVAERTERLYRGELGDSDTNV
ncbi:glycosyltransferase family 4 protein [Pyrococcus abyssi]|uniref:Galactosyltransferase or LPS biosynthesis rfbu related protein n=1 Tax=Pyrococcus abyssi (strain GE5 / Orsay) TaxID=272844 RepID=Q9UZA1_PYRAB|nr:glycosyltransferase family 4 protein [Pyrococcus abyssi]CAB50158.1 Hexosyltransferase, N-acetylglucosaminyl-phosphatidylinositol biosynthetic protein homolog [Pyrococcus abyssi GE5]CCE70690.1 TPA: galactosyltransferase or LPS biosynthesis rfbu related protein [Pyrococcus abyssi GE5]